MATVYCKGGITNYLHAQKIIRSLKSKEEKTSRLAAVMPIKDGNVYAFKVVDGEGSLFWRTDGLSWKHLRSEPCPRKDTKVMVYRHQLLSYNKELGIQQPQQFWRKEYLMAGKHAGKLNPVVNLEEWGGYPYVLVEYRGTFNLDVYVPPPSRSSRKSGGGTDILNASVQNVIDEDPHVSGSESESTPSDTSAEISQPVELGSEMGGISVPGTSASYNVATADAGTMERVRDLGRIHVRKDPRVGQQMQQSMLAGKTPTQAYRLVFV